MKEKGNVYQYDGKTVIIESFYGKEQAVAVCRYAKPGYTDSASGCYRYECFGKPFELTKEELQSAKRINSACDDCVFYRTSMNGNDADSLMACCAYRETTDGDASFTVDCTKHKTEAAVKKRVLSTKKAKEVFDGYFKDCRFVCGSGIETNNKSIRIESVSRFEKDWFIADRLVDKEKFDYLLKEATGKVVVIENFPAMLSKHQCINYSSYCSHFKACETDVESFDYDTYVYFCSGLGCNAFLFESLNMGIFTLHEITYKIIF